MDMKMVFIAILYFCLSPYCLYAQTCNGDSPESTPSIQFTVNNDGTVTDDETSLMWKVCSEGQVWDSSNCTGTATLFTWQDALNQAQSARVAIDLGFNDWRLPNRNELASIMEISCANPTINLAIFPASPSLNFWSSTVSVSSSSGSWMFNYQYGLAFALSRTTDGAVRLVRDSQ